MQEEGLTYPSLGILKDVSSSSSSFSCPLLLRHEDQRPEEEKLGQGSRVRPGYAVDPHCARPPSPPARGPQKSKRSCPLTVRPPFSGSEAETSRWTLLEFHLCSSDKCLFYSLDLSQMLHSFPPLGRGLIASYLDWCNGLETDLLASCWLVSHPLSVRQPGQSFQKATPTSGSSD